MLLCVACVALLTIIFTVFKPTPEPVYGGQPLSFWVQMLGTFPKPSSDTDSASNAIAHVGTASLPFLLRWIQLEPGHNGSEERARGTVLAFQILGTRATPALEDLTRLMNATNAPKTSSWATESLGFLGTNALPALLAVIQHPSHPRRWDAVLAVGDMADIGDTAKLLVPAIIACIGDKNDGPLPRAAIIVLGRLRASPELSVPALVSCLQCTNIQLRMLSADALGKFGPQAVSAIPALTNALTNTHRQLRDRVAEALHEIAPATFTNVPPPRYFH